jgi:hypothetical protein
MSVNCQKHKSLRALVVLMNVNTITRLCITIPNVKYNVSFSDLKLNPDLAWSPLPVINNLKKKLSAFEISIYICYHNKFEDNTKNCTNVLLATRKFVMSQRCNSLKLWTSAKSVSSTFKPSSTQIDELYRERHTYKYMIQYILWGFRITFQQQIKARL